VGAVYMDEQAGGHQSVQPRLAVYRGVLSVGRALRRATNEVRTSRRWSLVVRRA
jgi:hypothetical protein